MNSRLKISFSFVLAVPALVLAHGPQLQITRNATSGAIETRQIVDTHAAQPTNTALKRIYVMPMAQTGGEWYARPDDSADPLTGIPTFLSGPGIAYQYDTNTTATPGGNWEHAGSSTVPNLQGTVFDFFLTGGVGLWNGSGFSDPGTEQIQVYRTSGVTIADSEITTDAGGGDMDFAAVGTKSANPHSGALYRLLGDGSSPTSGGEDGVYLLRMQIRSTAPGVLPSDEFFLLMYKNVPQSVGSAAANFLATQQGISPAMIQVVPEPAFASSIALAALALRRRRRARC